MDKIRISKTVEGLAYRYAIADWAGYVRYLKAKGKDVPKANARLLVGFDKKHDFEYYYGDFEKQVPSFFGIAVEDCIIR